MGHGAGWGGRYGDPARRATVTQETNRSDSNRPQFTGKRKHEAPQTGGRTIKGVAATLPTFESKAFALFPQQVGGRKAILNDWAASHMHTALFTHLAL